ncbi:MAG: PQQ-binding-like beta-propeller repeat protein [bacterium]|jgi:outer membrane protein assembly factor BamB
MKWGVLLFCLIQAIQSGADYPQWNQFRGPWGTGVAPETEDCDVPLDWSEENNVVWKTPISHKGWSSPVIWDDQIWLTTATEDGREMYAICVDKNSGKILFNEEVFHNDHPDPLGNDVNTYASCTPIVEEGFVYIHFGSYGTTCIKTDTFEKVWERRDLPCNHFRGPASSPILYDNLLILTMDGSDLQYQVALNKKTGETVWKTDRTTLFKDLDAEGKPKADGDMRKAFSTPLLIEVNGQPQMVVSASYAGFGYDPRTGKELWKLDHFSYSNASMAQFGHDLVYLITGRGQAEIAALMPTGSGDITKSHVVWTYDKGIPSMVSPLLINDLYFMLNNGGVMTCLDAKTGEEQWRQRMPEQYYSSPIYVDGRIYCFSTRGTVTIVEPAREYKEINRISMPDGFMASPAVDGCDLYIRSITHLYRISNTSEK